MRKTQPNILGEDVGTKFFADSDELIEYLESDEFLGRAERICRWVVRRTQIDWQALLNDAYLKVRTSPSFLKVSDKNGFFKLFTVASINLRNDRFRKSRRAGASDEMPDLEITKADRSLGLEDMILGREFMKAIGGIRDDRRRRALEFRLQGDTCRKVGKRVGCSHVIVQIWLKNAIEAFLDGREL